MAATVTVSEVSMNAADNAYGLWGLAILNSVIFVGFAYSFFKPTTLRD
jgi:hypothetical protein